jgi:hypothetical protein
MGDEVHMCLFLVNTKLLPMKHGSIYEANVTISSSRMTTRMVAGNRRPTP